MGYAELIERVQSLPAEKQAEVVDFVEFLVQRNQIALCDRASARLRRDRRTCAWVRLGCSFSGAECTEQRQQYQGHFQHVPKISASGGAGRTSLWLGAAQIGNVSQGGSGCDDPADHVGRRRAAAHLHQRLALRDYARPGSVNTHLRKFEFVTHGEVWTWTSNRAGGALR